MDHVVRNFLEKFDQLRADEISGLEKALTVKRIAGNTLLVRQGEICNECFFVLKGCLRKYVLTEDGTEKTTAFYTEEQAVSFFSAYASGKRSEAFLYSLEDSILLVGDLEQNAVLFKEFPVLEKITQSMIEEDFGKMQDNYERFIVSSPEERYLNLLKERPGLFQRVSLYLIASYLGMTPESLSRIRKRVAKY